MTSEQVLALLNSVKAQLEAALPQVEEGTLPAALLDNLLCNVSDSVHEMEDFTAPLEEVEEEEEETEDVYASDAEYAVWVEEARQELLTQYYANEEMCITYEELIERYTTQLAECDNPHRAEALQTNIENVQARLNELNEKVTRQLRVDGWKI